MAYIILSLILWLIGAVVTFVLLRNSNNSTFDKMWFSCFWPCLVVLYPIHFVYNKYIKK